VWALQADLDHSLQSAAEVSFGFVVTKKMVENR
jgi:hypothetical protein